MNTIPTYDALIVGGGPAGSTCASILLGRGLHTLLIDRAEFPRVKLCAGWVSKPIWAILGISANEYPHGLWEWNRTHISFRGKRYTRKSHGYFVRREEFDDFLLKRSGVETIEGRHVRQIERDLEGYWVVDRQFRARYLIGAGGTRCPVARSLFPKPKNAQCGTQEREFEGNLEEIVACRAGEDGEPEILLHDDLQGYSWNVPKGHWLNVGTGTRTAKEVLPAWRKARAFFEGNGRSGTIPVSSRPLLDRMKGHGYVGFSTARLESCLADNVFLIGDALGLAKPVVGEGILPAVISGKLCGTAIADGAPETYADKLRGHPIISDYRLIEAIQTKAIALSRGIGSGKKSKSWLLDKLVVAVFLFLFSGRRVPGSGTMARMRK